MKYICFTLFAVLLIAGIVSGIVVHYKWENNYIGYWNLADKSSTLAQKSEYMTLFVDKITAGVDQSDNNALWFKTIDNNCGQNIKALTSLKQRLDDLKGADENSMAYQQAIQQITAQEQGEADAMIAQLHGCWLKQNYYILWNPILITLWVILGLAFLFGGIALV